MVIELVYSVAAVLLILGSAFALFASLGVLRFPDLYSRLHAAALAGSVGCTLIFAAVALVSGDIQVAIRAFLGILFLLLTTPIAAHILARSSYKTKNGGEIVAKINEFDV